MARHGSRRKRLWEIAHKYHCPLIGSCFEIGELRAIMKKLLHFPADCSDFVLHTTAVGACDQRTPLAEALQKALEKRYATIIQRLSTIRETDRLRQGWQQALRSGIDIPGTLWAAWSHPACDDELAQEIYGEIHMLQHQIGTARADLKALYALQADNQQLRQQVSHTSETLELYRQRLEQADQHTRDELTQLRTNIAERDARIAHLTGELAHLRGILPDLHQRQTLARRADDAQARAYALSAQCRAQCEEIDSLRKRLDALSQPAESNQPASQALPATVPLPDLQGKCVLCVGGQNGSVHLYRDIIERVGGRFLHHDGGLEESLHRIDSALAAADLVICQAGCISHNAYWRVKAHCKRTGAPCLYLKRGGTVSFTRLLSQVELTTEDPNIVDNNSQLPT